MRCWDWRRSAILDARRDRGAAIVVAAIDGRLPRGIGVTRLVDLPSDWTRQHEMLGLATIGTS
jgi:hypothetical protein